MLMPKAAIHKNDRIVLENMSYKGSLRDEVKPKWDGKEATMGLPATDPEFEGILQRGTEFRIVAIEYSSTAMSNTGYRVVLEIVKQAPQPYKPGNPVTY